MRVTLALNNPRGLICPLNKETDTETIYSQMYHSQLWIREMDIFIPVRKTFIMSVTHLYTLNIGISKHEKHLRLLSSGTKLFITFEFKGSSTQGERYTFFLFRLFHLPPPPPATTRAHLSQGLREQGKVNGLLPRQDSTPLTDFFKIPKILCARASGAWRHSHPLVNLSIGFLFWHLWTTHTPCTRVNHLHSSLHLTNPCAELKGSQPN